MIAVRGVFLPICIAVLVIIVLYLRLQSNIRKYKQMENYWDSAHGLLRGLSNDTATGLNIEIGCKFPRLLVEDPSIEQFIVEKDPIKCSSMPDWVFTANSTMYFTDIAMKTYRNISCEYSPIIRVTDTTYRYGDPVAVEHGFRLTADTFKITCNETGGTVYQNIQASVVPTNETMSRSAANFSEANDAGLHILLYPMDSMSRVNFMRKLPKFYRFLTEKLQMAVFEGFNVVGDGTPWAMIPMLAGHFQPELHEARKRFSNASFLDNWPWVFYEYRDAGYVTAIGDEQPHVDFFTYKLKGFDKQPVDHYLMPYEWAVYHSRGEHKPYCLGDTPRCILLLKWWMEYRDIYRDLDKSTFAFLFESEVSHDDYNLIQTMDEHYVNVFETMTQKGYLNDTFLLVMGDHGRRFGAVRQTQSGRIEEKMPFLAIYAPLWWRQRYPSCWRNMLANTHRLVTPFDLHKTLQSLINFTEEHSCKIGNISDRGISLFDEISVKRTCDHAAIRPHFCSCQSWIEISPTSEEAINVTNFIINQFNEYLRPAGNNCLTLFLSQTVSARKLLPSRAMMSFKESFDYDNIDPDLTADTKLQYVMYQARITTRPNGGDYEVSIHHYLENDKYKFSPGMVSRLNAYSDQPHCIMESQQQLREYCLCPDKLGKTLAPLVEKV